MAEKKTGVLCDMIPRNSLDNHVIILLYMNKIMSLHHFKVIFFHHFKLFFYGTIHGLSTDSTVLCIIKPGFHVVVNVL